MPLDHIYVKGAREHNLKNINVRIPRDKMVVITGLSGSGKSSLAFDTIYAEGQRRYVESLSAYARQFLGQMEKPDVDFIEGLSPAVSIDQKGSTRNPRSTVGTVTEIYDHLRLLFARVGVPHCPTHGVPIVAQTVQEIVDQIMEYPEGTRLLILVPLVRDRKREHQQLLITARRGAGGCLFTPRAGGVPVGAGVGDGAEVGARAVRDEPSAREKGRRVFDDGEPERPAAARAGAPRRPPPPLQVLARRSDPQAPE